MPLKDDPRIALARTRTMLEIVDRLNIQGLRQFGRELTGPCPGPCEDRRGHEDRFSINTAKGVFQCRKCGAKGGGIDLVMLVQQCDFLGAVTFLEGTAAPDPDQLARRSREAQARAEREAQDAAQYRQWAIERAREIWNEAQPFRRTIAEDYLAGRGLGPMLEALPLVCFRFIAAHPYSRARAVHHTGPALISALQGGDGRFTAVHQTWIDMGAPKGKAQIADIETGKPLASKMVQGGKKGSAIRLTGSACAATLVCGEGIETTATVWIADAFPGASFWVPGDLDNLAGKMLPPEPGSKWSGLPDIEGDPRAFVPPPQVDRLIYLQDGDSHRKMTQAKLRAGLIRAETLVPGLKGEILDPGPGVDFNDILLERMIRAQA